MQRRLEIDLLRTLAIGLMVLYHAAYDLAVFYSVPIDVFSGTWWFVARTSLILFLFVSGVTSVFWIKRRPGIHWRRFLRIGAAAFLVSNATYIIDHQTFVRFGVLHLIALSVLLLPFLARLRWWNIILVLVLLSMGIPSVDEFIPNLPSTDCALCTATSFILIPLGFPVGNFFTVDYVPLMPWFGIILLGFQLGQWWYEKEIHEIHAPVLQKEPWFAFLTWPGKHSLAIYLVHQPILLLVFWLIDRAR